MQIGLLFRYEVDAEEDVFYELTGQIPASLIGHISGKTNPEPSGVEKRLREIDMPYAQLYVPMFIYAGSRPEALNDTHTGVWGRDFDLNPGSVVPDLQLVCRWDIQDAALKGEPADWFTDLRELSFDERLKAIRDAATRSPSYAEARMFRPLREEDFSVAPNRA
jgi:hypothetical protein